MLLIASILNFRLKRYHQHSDNFFVAQDILYKPPYFSEHKALLKSFNFLKNRKCAL